MQSTGKWIRSLAVALFAIGLATSSGAQPHEPDEQHGGRFIAKHAEALELDDATRVRIESVVEDTRNESEKLRRAERKAARTLRDLLELDEPSEQAVMDQANVVSELEAQQRVLRIRAMLEIRSLMTPEQRSKLAEIRSADRPDRQSRRERREQMRACEPDVEKLCPDADHPRAVMHCLGRQREALSNSCGEAFDALRADFDAMREQRRGRRGDLP